MSSFSFFSSLLFFSFLSVANTIRSFRMYDIFGVPLLNFNNPWMKEPSFSCKQLSHRIVLCTPFSALLVCCYQFSSHSSRETIPPSRYSAFPSTSLEQLSLKKSLSLTITRRSQTNNCLCYLQSQFIATLCFVLFCDKKLLSVLIAR